MLRRSTVVFVITAFALLGLTREGNAGINLWGCPASGSFYHTGEYSLMQGDIWAVKARTGDDYYCYSVVKAVVKRPDNSTLFSMSVRSRDWDLSEEAHGGSGGYAYVEGWYSVVVYEEFILTDIQFFNLNSVHVRVLSGI